MLTKQIGIILLMLLGQLAPAQTIFNIETSGALNPRYYKTSTQLSVDLDGLEFGLYYGRYEDFRDPILADCWKTPFANRHTIGFLSGIRIANKAGPEMMVLLGPAWNTGITRGEFIEETTTTRTWLSSGFPGEGTQYEVRHYEKINLHHWGLMGKIRLLPLRWKCAGGLGLSIQYQWTPVMDHLDVVMTYLMGKRGGKPHYLR